MLVITDLQCRESNARSSFLERSRMKSDVHLFVSWSFRVHRRFTLYIYLFHGHVVLWELESPRITIGNLSPQNGKDFWVEVCMFITV